MEKITKILIILLNIGFVKKTHEKSVVKLKDHDHVAGKYQGSAHQERNLNLSLSKKSLLCFIICKIMIYIISFKKMEDIISK